MKKKTSDSWNEDFLAFLGASPSPFHAVTELTARLQKAGFSELEESKTWELKRGGAYYVVRGGSACVAFRLGKKSPLEGGLRLSGAHTDSPCLKIKPSPETSAWGYLKLGVEVYGGVLLSTWFDRDLSIAGRVSYLDKKKTLRNTLIDFKRPIATIPNLAIHLNRDVNEHRSINKQQELPPILCQAATGAKDRLDWRGVLADQVAESGKEVSRVLEYDLCLYDVQPPALVGLKEEFISSSRLDNLLSCYCGIRALIESEGKETGVVVCSDHEEVGSATAEGAQGTFLKTVLERICGSSEGLAQAMAQSLFISTDNSHGIHPNYPEKHDPQHAPILNAGPAIKVNANQRYATTADTAAKFALLCEAANVPYQRFVARSDMGCGSTIGPLTATLLGVPTVDVGVPTFAMHSIRELAGASDAQNLFRALARFF